MDYGTAATMDNFYTATAGPWSGALTTYAAGPGGYTDLDVSGIDNHYFSPAYNSVTYLQTVTVGSSSAGGN